MNCPQCNETIGPANYTLGGWEPVKNPRGVVTGLAREVQLHCGHCGTFTATENQDNHVTNITGPIQSADRLKRVERNIPGCRDVVRMSA